jgi:hypothetical protein
MAVVVFLLLTPIVCGWGEKKKYAHTQYIARDLMISHTWAPIVFCQCGVHTGL